MRRAATGSPGDDNRRRAPRPRCCAGRTRASRSPCDRRDNSRLARGIALASSPEHPAPGAARRSSTRRSPDGGGGSRARVLWKRALSPAHDRSGSRLRGVRDSAHARDPPGTCARRRARARAARSPARPLRRWCASRGVRGVADVAPDVHGDRGARRLLRRPGRLDRAPRSAARAPAPGRSRMTTRGLDDLERARQRARAAGEVPWPALTALPEPGLPPVPTLDAALLPTRLCDWLVDAAERLDVPLELVAAPALCLLGGLIGRRIAIAPK